LKKQIKILEKRKTSLVSEKIIIDLLIIPMDDNGKKCEDFSEDWEILFTTDRIRTNETGHTFIPLRTTITFDFVKNSYASQQFILQEWPELKQEDLDWFNSMFKFLCNHCKHYACG